jgi:lysophospholipase L1-like esterase
MKLNKTVLFVSVIFLLASIFFNIILYRQLMKYYRELQVVRLDPAGAKRFTAENLYLQENSTEKTRVILLGDSRITRWNPLPSLPNCQLLNRGISSETTAQTILRLDRDIIQFHPSIVVLQTGVNDLKAIGVFPKCKDDIINSCRKNLKIIVDRMTEHNIHVVILTIIPLGSVELFRRPIWSDEIYRGMEKVNEVIRKLGSQRVTVFDCDSILAVDKSIKPEYSQDALHLTPEGYVVLNDFLTPILEKIIEERPEL